MSISEELKQTVGRALGRIPSGVFILTASNGSGSTAMMVSWVQQAGFEPPALSLAVARGRPIGGLVRAAQRFALSVVPEADTSLMKRYARGVKPGEDPFDGVETFQTPRGLPVMKNALAWMECRLLTTCDFGGDHELFVGQVTAGELLIHGQAFTHQRGSGFHY
ncbi:MAG TPA: flavin reductase family protein [Tepidisphaeraceae bacterium]|nr:flavin reductase family protein [Tepidisphaeraceae bacterium]